MSVLADVRAALHAAVEAAAPAGVPVYLTPPDDIQETPCIIFDVATISRSFQSSGASVVRQSVLVLPFQGNASDTVPSLDDLTATVWEAMGGGGTLVLSSLGAGSAPQSAVTQSLGAGDANFTAMRVDTDVTVNRSLC